VKKRAKSKRVAGWKGCTIPTCLRTSTLVVGVYEKQATLTLSKPGGHPLPDNENEIVIGYIWKSKAMDTSTLVRKLLTEGRFEAVAEMAASRPRVLGFLSALAYDADPLVAWRAIETSGLAAARLVGVGNEDAVRQHLDYLVNLIEVESENVGFQAPQVIGEIMRNLPVQFDDYLAVLLDVLERHSSVPRRVLPSVLWAIGRLAITQPQAIELAMPYLPFLLLNPDPATRGLAAWCLAQGHSTKLSEILRPQLQTLIDDIHDVTIFAGGRFITYTIAELARQALVGLR
jgi:hypothetical protein